MRFAVLVALILMVLVHQANNASLSVYEQKKYKQFLEGQGLYLPDDDVVILSVHNFRTEVLNSPQAWLVEFYNSWCGFCQRFAPSWKALGTDIKGWADLVKVAALDCSIDENVPICREYEIMAYPTLRYFHEYYKPGPQNLGVAVTKGDDVETHRKYLVQKLVAEQQEGRAAMLPNLQPYAYPDLVHLMDGSDAKYGFLVIQRPDSTVGAEVSLDLHKTPDVVVRYALENNTNLARPPAVVALDKNGNHQVLQVPFESRLAVKTAIKRFLENKHVGVTDDAPTNREIFTGKWLEAEVPDMASLIQERARHALKERIKKMGDVVFQMDLETALRYSLKHEVATHKTLEGDQLMALRKYLQVLRKYFPFGQGGQLFLSELLVTASKSDLVQGSELADIINRAEQEDSLVFSSQAQWLGCRGSSPSLRGYPCGLWTLFHFLTVNSAEHNVHNRRADPLEVLDAMHSYVKNFFGCADCSQHFQAMAAKREMRNVSSLDSSVLWLWMAHNEVNKRLAGDRTEDPDYPKVQFPTKERCGQCRNAEDNTWNLMEVLRYLKHVYGSINVRYIGSDTRTLHVGLQSSEGGSSGGGGVIGALFKPVDMKGV